MGSKPVTISSMLVGSNRNPVMPHEYLLIIGVYVLYFAFHSLMASLWMKQRIASCCPTVIPYYRLIFNSLAIILACPLAYLAWRYPGEPLWQWHGVARYITTGTALLAFIALLYSLRIYDMREFSGLRQVRNKVHSVKDMEHFRISDFHRFVRHPWYFLILVILWSRDLSTTQLLITALISAYLVLGSYLEERKLLAYHGEVYKAYRQRVAGLFPLPWKILSRSEAKRLLTEYGHSADSPS